MINKLEDVKIKSFKNETINGIAKVNCFFGINGAGKSALANFVINSHKEGSVCFDTAFVRDNILLQEDKLVEGVKLKVGKQVKVENQISEFKQKIEKVNNEKSKLSLTLSDMKSKLFDILNIQLEEAKKEFDTQKIHQKTNAKSNPVKAYNYWLKDIDESLPNNFKNIAEIDQGISKLEKHEKILTEFLYKIKQIDFKYLEANLKKVIIKPDSELSDAVINWLKDAIVVHELNSDSPLQRCLFCQNKFNVQITKKRIAKIISSDYSKFIDKVNMIKELEISLIEFIDKNNIIDNEFVIKPALEEILDLVKEKLRNPTVKLTISLDNMDKIENTSIKVKAKEKEEKENLSNLQNIKVNAEKYVKSWIGLQLKKNSKCVNTIEQINELQHEIEDKERKLKNIYEQIEKLNSQQSGLSEFKDICNKKFKSIGLRLKLEIDDQRRGYLIKAKSDIPLHLEDLSEGEQRILAFMEFFYQMREDKSSLKNNIDIIVIDDPITSLDAENSYEIIEMINSLIEEIKDREIQIFVFTNSSQAFHNIAFRKVKGVEVKRWNIEKDEDGNSHVREINKIEMLNKSSYYKNLFLEVSKLAFENRTNLERKNNAVYYCNKARILFESHAYSNYQIANATAAENNIEELMKDYSIPFEEKATFVTDLDIINSNSHGKSNIDGEIIEINMANRQIQKAIRDIIGILYSKDKNHVEAMLHSIWNKDKEDNLKKWAQVWKES